MSIVNLSYTLDVDCPNCGNTVDLTDQDYEGAYTVSIFNNRWDELKGETVECEKCEHEFEISGVEC